MIFSILKLQLCLNICHKMKFLKLYYHFCFYALTIQIYAAAVTKLF